MTRAVSIGIILLVTSTAWGYDPFTTHPGITANALAKSQFHRFLREAGLKYGLFEELTLKNETDGPTAQLHKEIAALPTEGGFVPDRTLRQTAWNWTLLGSALTQHHRDALRKRFTDLSSTKQPFGIQAHTHHVKRAIVASTPLEREQSWALTLLSLGNSLQALQDSANPDDIDVAWTHRQHVARRAYERFVAIRHGRLGIPDFDGGVTRSTWKAFFNNENHDGLVDIATRYHFSHMTLPPSIDLHRFPNEQDLLHELNRHHRDARPQIEEIDLDCAQQRAACYVRDEEGRPLAGYRIRRGNELSFFLDDLCYRAAADRLLPLAVGFSRGLIDFLVRGRLEVFVNEASSRLEIRLSFAHGKTVAKQVQVTVHVDDVTGQRRPLPIQPAVIDEKATISFEALNDPQITRVTIVAEGIDSNDQPFIAVRSFSYPLTTPSMTPSSP